MICRVAGFVALLATAFAADAGDSLPAEYAIRWDIADGGPQSAAEAAAKLDPDGDKAEDSFEIRYFTVGAPPNLPPGFKAVIRERQKTNQKKYELTYKERGQTPLPDAPSLKDWACPVGATKKKKDELDVSFHSLSDMARNRSRSCTVESEDAPPVVPKALKATPAACTSTMTRLKFKTITIEEWHVSGGRTIVEVSQSGTSTKDLEQFRNHIAKPLIEKHKIKPLKASMTELGSACGK